MNPPSSTFTSSPASASSTPLFELKQFTLESEETLDLSQYFGKAVSVKSLVLVEQKKKKTSGENSAIVSMSIPEGEFVVCTLIPNEIPQVKPNILLTDTKGLTIHVNGGPGKVKVILEIRRMNGDT